MNGERKVLLLTGASRGIGHATVKRFGDAGWRIITCSRDEVPPECKRDPNWTHHITADLGHPADLDHLIAEGLSAKEIASQLTISTKTVEAHRTSLMRKLGVRKATELVRYALRHGLVTP